MMDAAWFALGGFILLGFTLEAITGFGGTVIALALGALLLPIATLVPVLAPLSLAMGLVLAWRHRGHIDHQMLWRMILPAMLAGTVVGYFARSVLPPGLMQTAFGLLVVWAAARALWLRTRGQTQRPRPQGATQVLITLAGMTHGLYASGGPLLVHALSGMALDKARFRVTLIVVWLVLDGALTLAFAWDGQLQPTLPQVLAYLPVVALGAWIGEALHHRVSEQHFQTLTAALLLITGILLTLR